MTKDCGSVKDDKSKCMLCMGQHAIELLNAGCKGMDEFKFCGLM